MKKLITALDIINREFNIIENIKKLKKYIYNENIFYDFYNRNYSFVEIFDLIIKKWNYNKILCESTEEFINKASHYLNLDTITIESLKETNTFENLKNLLEVLFNMQKELISHNLDSNYLYINYFKFYYKDNFNFLLLLTNKIIDSLMLSINTKNKWCVLYKKDNLIDVIMPIVDENIQKYIAKYTITEDLQHKKEILINLSNALDLDSKSNFNETDNQFNHYLNNCTNLLNNLNIRHKNSNLKIDNEKLIELYDILFKQILLFIYTKDNIEDEKKIKAFNNVIKEQK